MKTCQSEKCNHPVWGKGYCKSHQFKRSDFKPRQRDQKPIRKVSKKMSSELKLYSKLRREFLEANPFCAVYPNLPATDIHHKKGRGKYLNDTSTWLSVSREGHQRIEMFPVEAKERGWSVSRLGFCEVCGNVDCDRETCSSCYNELIQE